MLRLLVILFISLQVTLFGQDFRVNCNLDKSTVLIGDKLQVTLSVVYEKGTDINFPPIQNYWKNKNMEVFNVSNPEKKVDKDGEEMLVQQVQLMFWDTGKYILGPLPFYNSKKSDDTIFTNATFVNVFYPDGVTGDSTYMAPNKAVLEEPLTFFDHLYNFRYLFYILGFLIVLGLAGYFYLNYRKNAEARKAKLSPEAIANKALDDLLALDLISSGKFQQFHDQISLILRTYLAVRFNLKTLESTTAEILNQINGEELNTVLKNNLKEVLETADLVKYAKASPLAAANQFAIDYIRNLTAFVTEKLNEDANAKAS